MRQVKLKDVKQGEFIKRKADANKVYTRGDYDRSVKRFSCDDWDDISRNILLKGDALVFVDFEF